MLEVEWNPCTDPRAMLECLRMSGRASERQLLLLSAACCRRVWHLLEADCLRKAVDALERFADGGMDEASFRSVAPATHPYRAYPNDLFSSQISDKSWLPAYGINRVVHGTFVTRGQGAFATLRPCIDDAGKALDIFALAAISDANRPLGDKSRNTSIRVERAAQADLIRDIFGNPLRAAPRIDPAWLAWNGGTVKRLAEVIYEDRRLPEGTLDNDRLALLADALEEAGADGVLVAHARQRGSIHVRGCFLIDLLLSRK